MTTTTKTTTTKKKTTPRKKKMATATKPALETLYVNREQLGVTFNPRGEFPIENLDSVVTVPTEGIQDFGALLVLPKNRSGIYDIVDGYTRLSAYDKGIEENTIPEDKRKIPVQVLKIKKEQVPVYQIITNEGKNLTTSQKNKAIKEALNRGLSVVEVSQLTGLSRQHIYNVGFILSMKPEIQEKFDKGEISSSIGKKLKRAFPNEEDVNKVEDILEMFYNDCHTEGKDGEVKPLSISQFKKWANEQDINIDAENKEEKKDKSPNLKSLVSDILNSAKPLEDGSYSLSLSKEEFELLSSMSFSKSKSKSKADDYDPDIEELYLKFIDLKVNNQVKPLEYHDALITFDEYATEKAKELNLETSSQKLGDVTFSYLVYQESKPEIESEPEDEITKEDISKFL